MSKRRKALPARTLQLFDRHSRVRPGIKIRIARFDRVRWAYDALLFAVEVDPVRALATSRMKLKRGIWAGSAPSVRFGVAGKGRWIPGPRCRQSLESAVWVPLDQATILKAQDG